MKFNLSYKYTIFNIILIILFTTTFTFVFLDMQERSFENQLSEEAIYYGKILESSVAESVVSLRIDRIRENIFFLKQNPLLKYAYVIGTDGRVINDGEFRSKLHSAIPDDEFHSNATKSDTVLVQENSNVVDASVPIKLGTERLGHVRIGLSKDSMKYKMNVFTNASIVLGLLFIVFGSVITFFVIRKISKPLKQLTALTNDISKGKFDKKINVKSNDEISSLATAFNNMSSQLSSTQSSLITAKEEAERSNQLKTEFLAQISHEIRTPINTLINYSSLIKGLLNQNDAEETKEYFDIISNAGKRITRTVDLTLNMSEIIRGNYQPTFESFDIVEDLLRGLYLEFQSSAEIKNLKFTIEPENGNNNVFTDKYTATQIFQNLIDNAIKYTPHGFVTIRTKSNSENVIVSIIDSGDGISKEFQLDMFEPFRQEEQGYSRRYEGAGLGLSLVYKYCELTNAKIDVESKKGTGTSFHISIQKSKEASLN